MNKVLSWWSGGITSAVCCKICIDLFGIDNVSFVFMDTKNEDEDTYRFKEDCEKWYGKEIETITRIGDKYNSIEEIWYKYESLNVAHGAICSSELKRDLRIQYQKEYEFRFQAFGFDINESKRALSMAKNYPDANPVFPLLFHAYTKKDCIRIVEEAGIEVPNMYKLGFNNNNCFETGCVQGGIGYWQKMQREFPDKFEKMAQIEHELTDKKGQPVTMLKDQSKNGGLVFLKHHPDYPTIKDISMMKGREPEPLTECNGFCGTNDLEEDNSIDYYHQQQKLF